MIMIKRIIIIIHMILLMLALIIALFNKQHYYEYIYMLSFFEKTNNSFDLIIAEFFCALGMIIIDFIYIIISIAKKIIAIKQKNVSKNMKEVILWSVMLVIAFLTIYIFLDNYVMLL
ncbi:MAG: hypothetical protein IJH37_12295 [Clostridia bacterium]|nr:hypothetical protein [Clostridia bacterium]